MIQIEARDTVVARDGIVSPEGFLIVPGTLARTGVQEYLAYELGLEGGDAMRKVRLFRPADEVFASDSIASFEGQTVTIDHPQELVNVDNWKAHAVGDVSNVHKANGMLAATVCLKDRAAIEALKAGKRELSNGYRFTLDLTPGVTPEGDAYDGVQRNIRGNHIALVDTARCGSACRISDSSTPLKGLKPMTTKTVVVDNIPVEVSDTAAGVIANLQKQRDDALHLAVDSDTKANTAHAAEMDKMNAEMDKMNAEMDKMNAEMDKMNAEMDKMRKDVMTPAARDAMVADWAKMLETAKRLAPAVTTDGKTCLQVRREVVAAVTADNAAAKAVADAVLAGVTLDAAPEEAVRAAFNVLAASTPVANTNPAGHAAVADGLLGNQNSGATAMDARALFALNLTGA